MRGATAGLDKPEEAAFSCRGQTEIAVGNDVEEDGPSADLTEGNAVAQGELHGWRLQMDARPLCDRAPTQSVVGDAERLLTVLGIDDQA